MREIGLDSTKVIRPSHAHIGFLRLRRGIRRQATDAHEGCPVGSDRNRLLQIGALECRKAERQGFEIVPSGMVRFAVVFNRT